MRGCFRRPSNHPKLYWRKRWRTRGVLIYILLISREFSASRPSGTVRNRFPSRFPWFGSQTSGLTSWKPIPMVSPYPPYPSLPTPQTSVPDPPRTLSWHARIGSWEGPKPRFGGSKFGVPKRPNLRPLSGHNSVATLAPQIPGLGGPNQGSQNGLICGHFLATIFGHFGTPARPTKPQLCHICQKVEFIL